MREDKIGRRGSFFTEVCNSEGGLYTAYEIVMAGITSRLKFQRFRDTFGGRVARDDESILVSKSVR